MTRIVFQLITDNGDVWEVRTNIPNYEIYLNDKLFGQSHINKAFAIYNVLNSSDKFFVKENVI